MNIGNFARSQLSKVKHLPFLNVVSGSSSQLPSTDDCEGHRAAQNLAYQCAIDIGREIRPGWTEKQVAKMMDSYLRDFGVKSFFHKSFAWFGERTRFTHFNHYLKFLPSDVVLRDEDVIILDTAPILNGYVADIGFTFSLQKNLELEKARKLLRYFRDVLPGYFASPQMTSADIWTAVDAKLKEHGYDNCHKQYPFGVLGHRVYRAPLSDMPGVTAPFSVQGMWSILSRGIYPELLSETHVGSKIGLWAIEPHLGAQGFGAKFEEILVVDEKGARWLSDDVPHLLLPQGFC